MMAELRLDAGTSAANRASIMKTLLALLFAVAVALPALAQKKDRVSPHDRVTETIAGNEMIIVYGRPYTKDPKTGEPRKIWGTLVPFGQIWRLGADEATLFTTEKDITMGDKAIPAGTYSLFLLPEVDGAATLIVNKQTGQWGTAYDKGQDLARIKMKKEPLEKPVDQLTIAIDRGEKQDGRLKIMWEDTQYVVPFTVAGSDAP